MRPLSQTTRALVAGAGCLVILGGMRVGHAWPLWTGQTVVLAARPVDPRDLFRGEFVRLDTPLSSITVAPGGATATPGSGEIPAVGPWPNDRLTGRLVYVQLEPRADAPLRNGTPEYRAVSISMEPLAGATNLRGRIQSMTDATNGVRTLRVNYGLDAFFMQEGTARPVEDAMRSGRPVHMEVAIATSGRARIRNLIVDGTPLPRSDR